MVGTDGGDALAEHELFAAVLRILSLGITGFVVDAQCYQGWSVYFSRQREAVIGGGALGQFGVVTVTSQQFHLAAGGDAGNGGTDGKRLSVSSGSHDECCRQHKVCFFHSVIDGKKCCIISFFVFCDNGIQRL